MHANFVYNYCCAPINKFMNCFPHKFKNSKVIRPLAFLICVIASIVVNVLYIIEKVFMSLANLVGCAFYSRFNLDDVKNNLTLGFTVLKGFYKNWKILFLIIFCNENRCFPTYNTKKTPLFVDHNTGWHY